MSDNFLLETILNVLGGSGTDSEGIKALLDLGDKDNKEALTPETSLQAKQQPGVAAPAPRAPTYLQGGGLQSYGRMEPMFPPGSTNAKIDSFLTSISDLFRGGENYGRSFVRGENQGEPFSNQNLATNNPAGLKLGQGL